mmetsp:Transcript_57893/g.164496  ORF Transcript_57893/g.164496 Transcript_57893/m.164496 type:complete len:614 (+) Transcript_57893:103-1944(+)
MTGFDEAAADAPALSASLKALLAKDDFEGALKAAEEEMTKATASKSAKAEAAALRATCAAQIARAAVPPAEGALEAAVKAAEQSVDKSKGAKHDLGEAAGLHMLAKAHLAGKREQEALKASEDAVAKFQAIGSQPGEASALCTAARVYVLLGRNQKAFEQATKAVGVFRELGSQDGEAAAQHALFDTYMAMKKASDALQAAERMGDLCLGLGDVLGQGLAKLLSAEAHRANEDAQEAVTAAQEASKLFKKEKATRKMAVVNKLGAEAALAEGMVDDSLEMVERAVLCFKQAGDRYGQASAMVTMANLYSAVGEFDKATYRAETSAELYKKLKATAEAAASMRTASFAFLDRKMYEPKAPASTAREAMRTATTSLKLYESIPETESVGYAGTLNALAQAHLAAGDVEQATEKAAEARTLFTKLDHAVGIASTLTTVAQIQQQQGDTLAAVDSAREAQALFQEHDDKQGADFSGYLVDLFQAPPEEEGVVPAEAEPEKKPKSGPSISYLGELIPGGAAAVKPIAAYDAYQGRSATAPGQRRQASGSAAAGVAAVTKEEAVFSVRWVSAKSGPVSGEPLVSKATATKVVRRGMASAGPGGLVPSRRRYLEEALPLF